MAPSRRLGHADLDLSAFDVAALRGIQARVNALLGDVTATTHPDMSQIVHMPHVEELTDATQRTLGSRGRGVKSQPGFVLRRARWWSSFEKGCDVVRDYMRDNAPQAVSKRQNRRHAYLLIIGVLVRWLEHVHVPVTFRNIALNLDKAPSLMDRAFPGYAANGMLDWVFIQR